MRAGDWFRALVKEEVTVTLPGAVSVEGAGRKPAQKASRIESVKCVTPVLLRL